MDGVTSTATQRACTMKQLWSHSGS